MAIRNSHFSLQEYLNVVVVVVSILEITYSAFGKRISREVKHHVYVKWQTRISTT